MSDKWLVNDCLAVLQEKTFWHQLLELGLEDKTSGYTAFDRLADKIEMEATRDLPQLIVRNGTYFRTINLPVHTISFVQDIATSRSRLADMQRGVIGSSDVVVFNSEYTRDAVGGTDNPYVIIPIGVDFDLFSPCPSTVRFQQPTILWVGAASSVKGWSLFKGLVESTDYHFAVVAKDGARFEHPRVTNFGAVSQLRLADIMNACSMLLCTSKTETQHLAGIEAAACGLPIVAPNIGIYYEPSGRILRDFGAVCLPDEMPQAISEVLSRRDAFNPRQYFLDLGCDTATCMARWKELIE